jgi:Fe-S-cluster-containing hydrogenase component 2
MCIAVCPFGAMSFDTLGEKVIKCDLCDGEPVCVKFCETQAIQYVDASTLSIAKQREVAGKLSGIMQKIAAAIATV